MRESASPANQRWARSMAYRFTREFPGHKSDIEGEAFLGLVRAEKHHSCPGPDRFQAFAFPFVRGAITDYTKRLRRHSRIKATSEQLELVPDYREGYPREGWPEFRRSIAGTLPGHQRRVFLEIYGEDSYNPLQDVAARSGLTLDQVKKQHMAALESLRDLPHFHQVA